MKKQKKKTLQQPNNSNQSLKLCIYSHLIPLATVEIQQQIPLNYETLSFGPHCIPPHAFVFGYDDIALDFLYFDYTIVPPNKNIRHDEAFDNGMVYLQLQPHFLRTVSVQCSRMF